MSWCKSCARKYQRDRYYSKRLELGLTVNPRTQEEQKTDLEQEELKHRTLSNILETIKRQTDPNNWDEKDNPNQIEVVVCGACRTETPPAQVRPLTKWINTDNGIKTDNLPVKTDTIIALICFDCAKISEMFYTYGRRHVSQVARILS